MITRRVTVLAVAGVVLAGCTSSADGETIDSLADEVIDDGETVDSVADEVTDDSEVGGGEPVRDDVECDEDAIGSNDETRFTVMHYVVDGDLGAVCFGAEDDSVVAAWEQLVVITPPGQLGDLALFGGFEQGVVGDETTDAFVNVIDDAGTQFQMSVNVESAELADDDLLLTMAHEFSHVFTGLDTQIDRSDEAFDECDTYFNGEGCYRPDSLMFQWIEEFWGDGLIDEIDPNADATIADGEERCELYARFFGPYAASNPEEDFAESFSAYVFDVVADNDDQQRKLEWIDDQPGLAEFRERAESAGLTPAENNFEPCG